MKDFTQLPDLASERLGGKAFAANDEFFAPKQNLLKGSNPVFIEGKYTKRGKWMDGWETRRKRTPGYDWCIVRLGLAGRIRAAVVDTSFFKGNYPEKCSLEACALGGRAPYKNEAKRLNDPATHWSELLPQSLLEGDSQNIFAIAADARFTHVRLNIYPDGGVARLRLHGVAEPDAKEISRREIDLVAVGNGGSVVFSNDQFFGAPRNLLMPGRGRYMHDGWETRRRRGPGHDWVILKLGTPGTIRRIEVDTAHFKGNFPDRCSLEACYDTNSLGAASTADNFLPDRQLWKELLPQTKLRAHRRHSLNKLHDVGVATHVRFNIYPDGGVSRLRLFGRPAQTAPGVTRGVEWLNRTAPVKVRKILLDCCGSRAWVEQMTKHMPFPDTENMLATAERVWANLDRQHWKEAFLHHPAIGAKRGKKIQSVAARQWSTGEQSVAQKAGPQTLNALAAANRSYRARFGHIFLICAAGKTSDEILERLQQRLSNDPEVELRIAAEEQRKITRLRLEKLLAS